MIKLDLGCGEAKNDGFIGVDKRKLKGVDVIHDLEVIPYPFTDNHADILLASHIVEHLDPKKFIDIMNEWWRITKPDGQLLIYTPAGGTSAYWQDPTHINGCNGMTWIYFDPTSKIKFYDIYKPKPWKILKNIQHPNGILEVVLQK